MFLEIERKNKLLDNPKNKNISIKLNKVQRFNFKTEMDLEPKLKIDDVANFGKKSQALIGGYDFNVLKNITEHKSFDNLKDFQDSKPSANKNCIKIYSYRTNVRGDFSRYECVWYKFKSPEVIDANITIPKNKNSQSPEKLLEFAFDQAKKIVPKAADKIDKLGYKFIFETLDLKTGFHWINSDINIDFKNKSIYIKTPTLITNKFVPIFGGMTYCKLFTPKDAAIILKDIASGDINLTTKLLRLF